MLEQIVINHLTTGLTESGIPVYAEVPPNAPSTFVVIERTAGGRVNIIDNARIAVQSYAPTLYEAATLNETIKTLMFGITANENIGSCRLSSDYNFTDPTTKRYRYQAVFDIVYY